MATIRIGISGWRYAPWRGPFYPADLPRRAELEYASCRFATIEINGSFYSLQRPESYAQWYAQTPEGFVFSLKGGRYITHMRRLLYMRLHGDKELYRSGYSDRALARWAQRIAAWHAGEEPEDAQKISAREPPPGKARDVFCYFDNTDVKLRAPVDAQTLMRKLGIRLRASSGNTARRSMSQEAPSARLE